MNENPEFLTDQLITYIGNKRALLDFIGEAVEWVQQDSGKEKLNCLDIFSGSGIVGRYLKAFSKTLTVNDLENYACLINRCYLSNKSEIELEELNILYRRLIEKTENDIRNGKNKGFVSELYAPENEENVKLGERCFYTPHNAHYIDALRQNIDQIVPENLRHFFIAPLLGQASVHANTAGIFKGFYKNSKTGLGQFGGNGKNALSRICSNIQLPFPVLSEYECPVRIFQSEANQLSLSEELYQGLENGKFDLVYMDPPYNQHPYGSNYFMLNLIASYTRPDTEKISRVSGIPKGWNRSAYNKRKLACETFRELIKNIRADYVIVSFNNEGFIPREDMEKILGEFGTVKTMTKDYNAFRGSRNLKNRDIHVSEYLFVLKKFYG